MMLAFKFPTVVPKIEFSYIKLLKWLLVSLQYTFSEEKFASYS